ncbi:MAG TPA: hypothetical protein PLX33_11985 [Alphaproteobacteria bacterium]|nr:hypothetical protein [Alphaproteobacteria bacterium]
MSPQSTIQVPISTRQFLNLAEFLKSANSDADPVDIIALAIDYWMENASWKKQDLVPQPVRSADKGYHWKDVFLPNGTSLRMKYKDEWYYAAVQGDKILHEGASISPSEFANKVTQTSRNAWRDIWVKRPHDIEWIFADSLRSKGE